MVTVCILTKSGLMDRNSILPEITVIWRKEIAARCNRHRKCVRHGTDTNCCVCVCRGRTRTLYVRIYFILHTWTRAYPQSRTYVCVVYVCVTVTSGCDFFSSNHCDFRQDRVSFHKSRLCEYAYRYHVDFGRKWLDGLREIFPAKSQTLKML